jgi:simple sugar transport system permease protein
VLFRTPYGNWIFAASGDANAARNVGVPVAQVKISLLMLTAASAALLAALQVLNTGSADVLRGEQKELEAVAAAVIGGNLLTGAMPFDGLGFAADIIERVFEDIVNQIKITYYDKEQNES